MALPPLRWQGVRIGLKRIEQVGDDTLRARHYIKHALMTIHPFKQEGFERFAGRSHLIGKRHDGPVELSDIIRGGRTMVVKPVSGLGENIAHHA